MTEFFNLSELKREIMKLDIADERKVLIGNPDNSTQEAKYFKAIYNTDKNRISAVVSNRYTLIQHRELFEQVIDILSDMGISCEGRLSQYHAGDVACLEFRFNDKKYNLKDDSKEGVNMGIRVQNSLNSWGAVSCTLWCYRQVCSNGLMMWKIVEGVNARANHVGKLNLGQMIRHFISKVADFSPRIKALINESIEDTAEWEIVKELLEVMIKTDKYRNILISELEKLKGKVITRYDIYNLLTSLASDNEVSLKESAMYSLQKKSQEVLQTPLTILTKRYKKAEIVK